MSIKKYLDLEGLQTFKQLCDEAYSIHGALTYKGSVPTISGLPTVSNASIGDMYNVVQGGNTTADFVEGAGHTLQDGDNVVAVNTAAEGEPAVMKWDILGGVFSVDDRLQFGSTMPANPEDGQTFLYLGETSYNYADVENPDPNDNPAEEGWYEFDQSTQTYSLSEDTAVDSEKTYYTRTEDKVKGVIYVYNDSADHWVPQSSGDVMTAITQQEINALF